MSNNDRRSHKQIRASIKQIADDVFGDEIKAQKFLRRPHILFDENSPAQVARSKEGALRVELLLGRIQHGVYI